MFAIALIFVALAVSNSEAFHSERIAVEPVASEPAGATCGSFYATPVRTEQ